MVAPASSAPPPTPKPAHPWQLDHWPQTQPRQQTRAVTLLGQPGFPEPIDPQNWVNPDHMTWADYRKPPGRTGPTRRSRARSGPSAVHLVLADYPNQPFVVTQPQGSTVFGNLSVEASGVLRDRVAQFYRDFLNKPGTLNRGHTIHEYWMEDSGGRYGVDLTAFGPYEVPWARTTSTRWSSRPVPAARPATAATRTCAPTPGRPGRPTSAPRSPRASTSCST